MNPGDRARIDIWWHGIDQYWQYHIKLDIENEKIMDTIQLHQGPQIINACKQIVRQMANGAFKCAASKWHLKMHRTQV